MHTMFSRRNFLRNSARVSLAATTLGSAGSLLAACGDSTPATGATKTTIKFWHTYNITSPENQTLLTKVIPAFNKKHPNIQVQAQDIPYDSMLQKLIASVAGGSGPDVVRADIIWMPQLAKIGALAKMDDIVNQQKNAFYSAPLATCFYNGSYYGLPLDTNTKVMFYNKDVLAKAGISQIPTTTAEFKQACLKITALGNATYGYAEGGTYDWATLPWVWSFGGAVTDDNFQKASGYINSPESVASLEYLIDLYKTKALSPSILGGSNLGPSDAIGKDKAGFIIDGPWTVPTFEKTYPKLKFDMALMPAGPDGKTSSIVGGEDIAVMNSSKSKDAAKTFAQFMITEEAQILMGTTGQMPILKSLAASPKLPAYFKTFNQQLETAKPRTVSPNYPKISTAIGDAFDKAFRNKMSAKAALDAAASQIDALL